MGSQREPRRIIRGFFFMSNMSAVLLYTLLCAFAAIALLMLGLGIKMIFKKHGEFKRHCSSMDPYTGEGGGCVCGKAMTKRCSQADKYTPLEVNDHLMDEIV